MSPPSLSAIKAAPEKGPVARGFTIVEVLIASALMLVLTVAFFQILAPTLHRSEKIDWRQENMQRFIIFKEYITKKMSNSRLVSSKVQNTSIVFYVPYQVETEYGNLNQVNIAEMTYWNETTPCSIYLQETAGKDNIIIDNSSGENRALWNLGKKGVATFSFDTSELPLLTISLSIENEENPENVPWEKSLEVYINNFQ